MKISLKRMSLKWKASIIFVLLVTFPTLFVSNMVLLRYDQILRNQFTTTTENNLRAIELNLSDKIKAIQDMSDYMIYKDEFRLFMTTPFIPVNMEKYYEYKQQVEGFVTFQLISKRYIKSISIQGYNGNGLQIGEPVEGVETSWNRLASEEKGAPVWTDSYPIISGWSGPKRVISMLREINSYEELTKPIGRITVRLDEAEFTGLMTSVIPSKPDSAFILKADGSVLLHNNVSLIGQSYPDSQLLQLLNSTTEQALTYRHNGTTYAVIHRNMQINGWKLVAMVPQETITEQTNALKSSVRTLLITIVFLGILALIGFFVAIIRPILAITKQTARLSKGDFEAHVVVRWHDEIGELGHRFNRMVVTIKELIEYKYKLEIRQRESDLNMLMRQIDPHFLYNTLDMIRWTARMEKAPETSQLIETLSRFFRTSLSRDKRWTTIRDELVFVRAYLELQHKRLGQKLVYSIFMESQLEEVPILNKIIQPLVENSIKHGFHVRTGGRIQVRAYRCDQEVWIDVLDNGKGFNAQQRASIQDALEHGSAREEWLGHALSNIHERIVIVSGKNYGLEIVEVDEGSCVRLKMPLMPTMSDPTAPSVKEGER
ncbi:cache domain-containing sensor histidine kinase [Paenibacillus planticolens]|uniref:HAMP domain-containing protein n=1 Tax=Paenibacillus planticolens TaxID=2654976 RepID=A0ABX1ZEY6_9BACL|nr:sensor histidine kinase [Paenibacillus planticolens]NOU98663.1 HAMP domain-containing protein [Paenibacillus planticolens]